MDRPGQMAVFVRVVEAGGFSAAARALKLTPSAVSKLIGRLEDRLGARLLYRTTRRLGLTHEGVAFYQRCLAILREIDEAEQAVSQLRAMPHGRLRVNAAVAFAIYQIVPLLPEFLTRYPQVHLEFSVTDRVIDLIEEGADLAVRIGVHTDSSLITRTLAEDRRLICAAPSYIARHGEPRTPQELADHNCLTWIGVRGGLNEWPFDGPDGRYTITVAGNAEVDNGEALYEMALAGIGLAQMAEFRVGTDIKAGRLVSVLADVHRTEPLPIHAVYPHRRHLSANVRAFVDFLIDKFAPVPPWRVE